MVYTENSASESSGEALVSYCFMSDGSPTKVTVAKGAEGTMSWANVRAREFFYATPMNGGWADARPTQAGATLADADKGD